MTQRHGIVLAAGKGTRMKSDKPKVCHECFGKPMVNHCVDSLREADCDGISVVLGEGKDTVEAVLSDQVQTVEQEKQLGTGHAVQTALEQLSLPDDTILLVTCGDIPGVRPASYRKLFDRYREQDCDLVILTARLDNPEGYGRIVKDDAGNVVKIVEEVDAGPEESKIQEINTGILCGSVGMFRERVQSLDRDNEAGEFYLTDVVQFLNQDNRNVRTLQLDSSWEITGINTRKQLVEFEKEGYRRMNERLLREGVTIRDPERTKIAPGVDLSRDVEVEGDVKILGNTSIEKNTVIEGPTKIVDSDIGEGCTIRNSTIRQSSIGENVDVGPFCHVRPGTKVGDNVRLGNFVEIKKSSVDSDTNVAHLSYVGDADLGRDVNVGAGTITCNYDGINKHETVIEDGVFIGSNTELVAPVKLGERSFVGAGTTVTRDVPPYSLAVSRVDQSNREDWVRDVWERKKKRAEQDPDE